MQSIFKKNLGTALLLIVVGLQFFNYLGSILLTPDLSKSLHGYRNLKTDLPFLVDWVWITVFGRIIGGYILCKLAICIDFFNTMRIIVISHTLLAILVSSINITSTILYQDIQFLFAHRFFHAFLIPASFMLPTLFLLNQNEKKPIMLSAYSLLAVSTGSLLIYKYLAIVEFAKGWNNIIFYVSIISCICYFFAEKFLRNETCHPNFIGKKPTFSRLLLVCTFGGICGISFSYHFAFVDSYVNNVIICKGYTNASFSYFYYALITAIIPVAKLVYKKDIFIPLKFSSIGIILTTIIMTVTPTISLSVYILEQIIFGVLVAVLIVPCHSLVHQLFRNTNNYFKGMFWFTTFSTLFSITPHFFLKLLGIKSLPWLGIIYVIPIALLFILALSKYEKEIKTR